MLGIGDMDPNALENLRKSFFDQLKSIKSTIETSIGPFLNDKNDLSIELQKYISDNLNLMEQMNIYNEKTVKFFVLNSKVLLKIFYFL